jgi:hypothetical protein
MLGHIVLSVQIEKLAGHAQMDGENAIRVEFDENVLPTTIDRFNADAFDFAIELSGLEWSY